MQSFWVQLALVVGLSSVGLAASSQTDSTAYLKYESQPVEAYRIRFDYQDPFAQLPPVKALPAADTTRRPLRLTLLQSVAIAQLAERLVAFNKSAVSADGYRIQLFTGERGSAGNVKYQAQTLFPAHVCYVDYERPYFKVRLGDFLTRREAETVLRLAHETWPGAFIVPSRVNLSR